MKLLKQTLSLLLTIAALTVGQSAWAANTWTISSSTSGTYTTFTISRSGDTSKSETVLYRFVGLSAYAGRHFVVAQINGGDIATSQQMSALSGTFTFAATETSKSVTIKEMDADNAAYIFQNGTSRNYKLEVTDQGGFLLKDCTRSFTTGTSVPSSGAFNVKDITIRSGEISVTDAGYAQGYHSMTVDNYFNNAAPKAYFQQVGAQLRMTLTFQCKEVNDGWQYVQIYANQSTSNIDTGAGDGNPGDCSYAKYVAGFEHKDGNADTEYKSYTFPVTSANNNEGATNPWGHGSGYNLHKQIFNNSRASDGRLIIPLDLSSLYVRYNASGTDKDDWVAKNTVAHIQAIDATAPTALDIFVAPGYHAKGNTVYVSVAFKEIVTSSNAKLNTNWGTLSYNTGSGSNVLTFKGTIGNSATGSLNITGYSGTITDLAGNNFAGTITGSNLCTLDASYAYTINYDLDGGSVATANPTTYTYETATFTLNNPTRTGYTFDGWTGSNGTTASTDVQIAQYSHGDKSYTANWTINTYNITYEGLDGATFTTTNNSYTVETPDITLDTPTKTGYTFTGWTGSNGTTPETTVTIPAGSTEDKSYTANWRTNTYTVHFDANGGSGNMSDMSFTYGETKNLTTNTFSAATGYIFNGWNTQANGTGTSYTDGQSVSNLTPDDGATFTLYAQWTDLWGMAGGADGTEQHPYIITTTAGLHMLATYVNNGTSEFPDTYFKLGADITYTHGDSDTENNYTAIGNVYHAFCGIFDGDGHAVSGIRIYKPNEAFQGPFGRVYGATVKNVILNDARITGYWNVGGISGQINGNSTIENCLVLNTSITADVHGGAVIGYKDAGTHKNNYYHNCSLTKSGTTKTIDIGLNNADCDGARSAHTLTLPANVSVSAATESVTYNNVTYYASNSTVTLSPAVGYILTNVTVNGTAATDNGDGSWTFTMPAADATVSATCTDVWGIADGADGTEQNPYIITTTTGLDLIATYVNNGISDFPDTYFKLDDDITYTHGDSDTENNYTAIGTEQKAFLGNFDGDGHTISGIRIYKPSENYQGLFGRVWGTATVKNVILNDARITGKWYIGGFSGQMNGNTPIPSIQNCLVLNSSFTANSNSSGAVIGASWKGTFNNNHYHNCSLTINGTTKTTDIGIGNKDHDGARSVHTLTLPDGVSVSAASESVIYNNVTYYASNSTVTLSPAVGYILTNVTVNGTAATDNGDGSWTFTMPAADATVSAILSEDPNTPVAILNDGSTATSYYIDATYTTAEAALRAALDGAANASGSTVTVTLFRDVTLTTDYIECDDGTYTLDLNGHSITGSDGVLVLGDAKITLIDGSSAKTGSITDTGSSEAIVMNAGTLNCTGCTISSNISTGTGVVYNGGTLTLTDCTITGNTALHTAAGASITLTNCTITGTSYGIRQDTNSRLSLTDCTITGNVGIVYMVNNENSQSFIGNTIKGCAFAGILINDCNVNFKNLPNFGTGSDANGCDIVSANGGTIDFNFVFFYDVPATPITVKAVEGDNSAYVDKVLDADHSTSYTFATGCNKIEYPKGHANQYKTIPIEEVFGSLNPNYVVTKQGSDALLIKTIVLTDNANNATTIETYDGLDCAVTLQGRTLYKDGYWNTLCLPFYIFDIPNSPLAGAEIRSLSSANLSDTGVLELNFSDPIPQSEYLDAGTPYIIKWASGDNLVDPFFPFASVEKDTYDFTSTDGTVQFKGTYAPINFTPGDESILFMGADNTLYYPASGAYVNAFRAYFKLTDPNSQVRSFVLNFGSTDDDEDPTAIAEMVNGQSSMVNDVWYDLNGRRLTNKPTRPGIYIHNGKKEILK